MSQASHDEIRQNVRNRYKQIVLQQANSGSCCSGANPTDCAAPQEVSSKLGYSTEELNAVPEGANLGLGCGNPQTIADLKAGESVLDLGSGGGFDCFLAARQVGESGRVIGVDMTPEMVSQARKNALKGGFKNAEFRLGEIEHLPVADESIDVIISNCVINLSPDKPQVFREAYRALKPGGRIAVSDIVTTAELPVDIKNDLNSLSSCISGASSIQELEKALQESGFSQINILPKEESREFIRDWVPGANLQDYIVSAVIKAVK
ncbi:arsenite methyltransferase [Gorillibacterium sp. sgz5001074]|uniref:arsenite methyltransferase n=1 Tax=Gorillibacterium sp. sgz5001074 TaxID=3446695 RepID=UPI003F670F4E